MEIEQPPVQEKIYFTMAELVDIWLAKHPNDKNSYSLVIDACAGYVRTGRGFIWYQNYELEILKGEK